MLRELASQLGSIELTQLAVIAASGQARRPISLNSLICFAFYLLTARQTLCCDIIPNTHTFLSVLLPTSRLRISVYSSIFYEQGVIV